MTVISHPKMTFERVSNGWKCTMEVYPCKLHYIKLDGIIETPWMLDHAEVVNQDIQEYIDMVFSEYLTFSGQSSSEKSFQEHG
jgi:hypothetical protein